VSRVRQAPSGTSYLGLALSLFSFSTTPKIEILVPKSDRLGPPLQILGSIFFFKLLLLEKKQKRVYKVVAGS
jgi:hypothetical protein